MRQWIRVTIYALVIGGLIGGAAYAIKPPETPEHVAKGKIIYEGVCIFCHGMNGKGDGPAAFYFSSYSAPRPRDFTLNEFKFRTTPFNELPSDQDLFRVVTNGVAGYMPSFLGLSEEERWAVIAYIKTFNPAFKNASPATTPMGFPKIPSSPDSIDRGRVVYLEQGCIDCHGNNGKGDGEFFREGLLTGQNEMPSQPRDLTNLASFKNGATPRDIARTIMTGLSGSPMMAHDEEFAGNEEDVWHVVNYILSLSREPRP